VRTWRAIGDVLFGPVGDLADIADVEDPIARAGS
jgi:hypothetical protein